MLAVSESLSFGYIRMTLISVGNGVIIDKMCATANLISFGGTQRYRKLLEDDGPPPIFEEYLAIPEWRRTDFDAYKIKPTCKYAGRS